MYSCADNFVDRHNGIGFTYESGWHKDEKYFENVLLKVKLFLWYTKVVFRNMSLADFNSRLQKIQTKKLMLYESIITKSDNFYFTKKFENFEQVSTGTVLTIDNKKEIYAKQDSFILFIKTEIKKNEPVCYQTFNSL